MSFGVPSVFPSGPLFPFYSTGVTLIFRVFTFPPYSEKLDFYRLHSPWALPPVLFFTRDGYVLILDKIGTSTRPTVSLGPGLEASSSRPPGVPCRNFKEGEPQVIPQDVLRLREITNLEGTRLG